MTQYLADASTVLVLNGKPYRLVRERFCTCFYPCRMCDLKQLCESGNGAKNLLPLCTIGNRSGAWFFKENYDCVNHHILEYVQFDAQTEILDL